MTRASGGGGGGCKYYAPTKLGGTKGKDPKFLFLWYPAGIQLAEKIFQAQEWSFIAHYY